MVNCQHGMRLAATEGSLKLYHRFASTSSETLGYLRFVLDLARRGRSLGIHLVLATQRPGGVVSPEIRANTDLRIALRVTDASGSTDVIDSGGAVRIEVLADGGEQTGWIMADIDPAKVDEARSAIPALRHDRSFPRPESVAVRAAE